MPEPTTLMLFGAAAIVLVAVPGPNLIYIATRTLTQGRRTGVAAALGVEAGTLVHVIAAAVGVSAIIASSATAFTVVKYLGAVYLVVLGIRALVSRSDDDVVAGAAALPLGRAFAEGALVNVLNPKVALFFLAFLPQFIDPGRGSVAAQTLVLGVVFFFIALVMDLLYVGAAGVLGRLVRGRADVARHQRRVTGAVYLGLGGVAALASGPAEGRR